MQYELTETVAVCTEPAQIQAKFFELLVCLVFCLFFKERKKAWSWKDGEVGKIGEELKDDQNKF